jgi:hypothetical protein
LQDPPKFTPIGIFGLKIYHLATMPEKLGDKKRKKGHERNPGLLLEMDRFRKPSALQRHPEVLVHRERQDPAAHQLDGGAG